MLTDCEIDVISPAIKLVFTATSLAADTAELPAESVTTTHSHVGLLVGYTASNTTPPPGMSCFCATSELPESHVEVDEEYNEAVYGGVPPDHVDEKDTPCPLSIVGFNGDIEGVLIPALWHTPPAGNW
jgi:hypothetical protein